jgi:hypothetical protein
VTEHMAKPRTVRITENLTNRQVRERMERRDITVRTLAETAQIGRSDLSGILLGRDCLGRHRRARLTAAIQQLGLDRDDTEQ